MNIVEIFYTSFHQPFSTEKWQYYLNKVPSAFQTRALRYLRWQDQHSSLLSHLLLQRGLLEAGYPAHCLNLLQHEKHGRPFIDSSLDFNLSHSGEYVVCALFKSGRGGVDIEKMRPIEVSDFRSHMSLEEWSAITVPEVSYPKFFDYWTCKESVMKADGRGLYIPLESILLQGPQALLEEKVWFLHKVEIDSGYACHLATTWESLGVQLKEIKF